MNNYVAGYMTLLLLSMSFSLFVRSSVYYIKPDNQNANISANTLEYYLQNATNYLASNNQLYFLPGVHKLNTVIKIQNVYNFSLIGVNTKNDSVIIHCFAAGGIAIINSSYTNLKHLTMKRCKSGLSEKSISDYKFHASLLIDNSYSIHIHQLAIINVQSYSIVLINALSDSTLSEVSSSGILIVYETQKNVETSDHNLTIINYYPISHTTCSRIQGNCYNIELKFFDYPYYVNINISEITFTTENSIFIESQTCKGFNKVTIFNCNFTNIALLSSAVNPTAVIEMYFIGCNVNVTGKQMNQINILKCNFFHYNGYLIKYIIIIQKEWYSYNEVTIHIGNSEIFENQGISFLMSKFIDGDFSLQPINIIINNTKFACIELSAADYDIPFFNLQGVVLLLEGPIIFTKIEVYPSVIFGQKTHIYVNGYIGFSNVYTVHIVQTTLVYLNENTLINFTSNVALNSVFERVNYEVNDLIPHAYCNILVVLTILQKLKFY